MADFKFFNQNSGEHIIHRERADGKVDIFIENAQAQGSDHFHAVRDKNGNVSYMRDFYGRIICDDKLVR